MDDCRFMPPYKPLPPEDSLATRLVKLLPGKYDDPIQCELEPVSLGNKPPYIALSYVWGDPTGTVMISLDGVEHAVTKNLESFLRHKQALLNEIWIVLQRMPADFCPLGPLVIMALTAFRLELKDSEDLPSIARAAVVGYYVRVLKFGGFSPSEVAEKLSALEKSLDEAPEPTHLTEWNDAWLPRFWIDALSIYQNDPVERGEQVKRMNHVYRSASSLCVWAKNHCQPALDLAVEEALGYIEVLSKCLERFTGSPIASQGTVIGPMEAMLASADDNHTQNQPRVVDCISILFTLDWFSRAWIFQEVALSAPNRAEFWFGFRHINLSRLVLVGHAYIRAWSILDPSYGCARIIQFSGDRVQTALFLDKLLSEPGKDSLDHLPCASDRAICDRLALLLSLGTLRSNATDRRDIIYCLYGLLSSSRLPPTIQPDYTSPVSVVYHSVAVFLLSHGGAGILAFLLSAWSGMSECPNVRVGSLTSKS